MTLPKNEIPTANSPISTDSLEHLEHQYKTLQQKLSQTEQELVQLKQEINDYKAVFEHAPLMIWLKDLHTHNLKCNKLAANVVQKTPKEIEQQKATTWDLFPKEDANKYHIDDQEVFQTGQSKLGILETLETSQGKVYVKTDKILWSNTDGTPKGVIVFVSDITELKKMEDELQRKQRHDALGRLAGGIAHDFNNLLLGVFGHIELALTLPHLDKTAQTYLSSALSVQERASRLTQQLLSFAKGGAPIKKTASVKEIIEDTVAFVLSGSAIKCKLELSEHLWPSDVDKSQISQVIENLVINAQQSMNSGGEIFVSAKNVLLPHPDIPCKRNGQFICIQIQDQGVGIQPELFSKIFEPFFSTKKDGTGMGLASAYSIIQGHNGEIFVHSTLGKGTRFDIYLPASQKQIKAEESDSSEIRLGNGKILIMDDEEVICQLLKESLHHFGYQATYAKNNHEAEHLFQESLNQQDPFQVVLLDLTIPGDVGGIELISKLRQKDPSIKAIVSSGYSDNPVMANPEKYGFDAILKKPYRISALVELIQKMFKKKKKETKSRKRP